MTQEQKIRAFSAHFGCETDKGKLVAIDENKLFGSPMLYVEMKDGGTVCGILDNCKLLLTPLSEIADEDAVELAKIASSWDDAAPLDPLDVPEWLDEIMSGNCAVMADYVDGYQILEVTDFLSRDST